METNTESLFFFPCCSAMAGCECGAGVRAALTMGDGVERGRGQGRVRSGQPGHTHRRIGATQGGEISPYISPILQSWTSLSCINLISISMLKLENSNSRPSTAL